MKFIDIASEENSSGTTTFAVRAAIQTLCITVSGSPRLSNIVLQQARAEEGAQLVVKLALPETEGIEVAFRNQTEDGDSILPEYAFESGLFTTDGCVRSATFTFVFNAALAWEYLSSVIPS